MKQIKPFSDRRHGGRCSYCGGMPDDDDHVPPKLFLDRPYPENLAVVPSCRRCNGGASLDEEYVSCALEYLACGSTDPTTFARSRIVAKLAAQPALAARLRSALNADGKLYLDSRRLVSVFTKIAMGLAVYEFSENPGKPSMLNYGALHELSAEQVSVFETPPPIVVFPELGSRAMQRVLLEGSQWIDVQPRRFRYLAHASETLLVRFVIRDIIAVEAFWR